MTLMVNNLEYVTSVWYTGKDTVGFVLCKDTVTGRYVGYVGNAPINSEVEGIKSIMSWGAKLPHNVAEAVFERELNEYKYFF